MSNIVTKCRDLISLCSDFRGVRLTLSFTLWPPAALGSSHCVGKTSMAIHTLRSPHPGRGESCSVRITYGWRRKLLFPRSHRGVSFTSRGPGSFICQFLNPSLPIATAEGGVSSTQTLRQWGRAVSSNESSGPSSRLEGYKVVGSKPRSLQELWEVDSREESTKEEVVGVPG